MKAHMMLFSLKVVPAIRLSRWNYALLFTQLSDLFCFKFLLVYL